MRSTAYGRKLFNGNISYSTYAISNIEAGAARGKFYIYDQLNRLTAATFGVNVLTTSTTTLSNAQWANHVEKLGYDANGNITLKRCWPTGITSMMDMLTYNYNVDANSKLINNRLNYVTDQAAAANFPDDIDSQSPSNYTYDKTGNMIGDVSTGMDGTTNRVNWTVYGKIASIKKSTGTISYGYDASGNRITKTLSATKADYYVRDAQGNTMGIYSYDNTGFTWAEQHLYGSSRLGMVKPGLSIPNTTPLANANYKAAGDPITNGTEGKRVYELTNHLGNVMVTIGDRKIGVDANSDAVIDYYTAEVLTAQDYYAFGSLMPGRQYSNAGAKYKYGFNGQEKSDEVDASGNSMMAEFWQYDSRIGKRWNVDPNPTAEESGYATNGNNPVRNSDPKGDTPGPGDGDLRFGVAIVLGGNQERGIKLSISYTTITANKGINLEGGLRLGLNYYSTYKGAHNIVEGTASWYAGAVFGSVVRSNNMSVVGDEYKFAGSGQSARARGGAWGIGGVGMLTSKYKGTDICGYMGTQYLKGNFDNVSLTINHTNDAMMGAYWLKMGLPPILGFQNRDWNRTTELSASLNINNSSSAVSVYGRVSIFTPKILLDPLAAEDSKRVWFETGKGTRNPVDGSGCQKQYALDPSSHGTFFSFWQIGATGQGRFGSAGLNYSYGNPQPPVQNQGAHKNGYGYPLLVPDEGTSPNQSKSSLGGNITIQQ